MISPGHIEKGRERAERELREEGLDLGAPGAGSVVLKYALVFRLEEEGVPRVRGELRAALAPHLDSLRLTPAYCSRLADLVLDALLGERLAPELRLLDGPLPAVDGNIHALVFSATPHIANELAPLMVDARTAGGPAVLGVHKDWVRNGCILRAIRLSDEGRGLVEADLPTPLLPSTYQVLALDLSREEEDQRAIEERLPFSRSLNPLAGAARLSDKVLVHQVWSRAGLPVPRQVVLEPREPVTGLTQDVGPRVVVKPSRGTEGRGVGRFDLSDPAGAAAFEEHCESFGAPTLLVQEERGDLRLPGEKGPRSVTLRLNVTWDGCCAQAGSGYFQVALDPGSPASAGRGGSIASLTEVGEALALRLGDWKTLRGTAERAVAVLAGHLGNIMPRLTGVDLLLDRGPGGGVEPCLLEANPRPSGMGHSTLLDRDGPTPEPGVSAALFHDLPTGTEKPPPFAEVRA